MVVNEGRVALGIPCYGTRSCGQSFPNVLYVLLNRQQARHTLYLKQWMLRRACLATWGNMCLQKYYFGGGFSMHNLREEALQAAEMVVEVRNWRAGAEVE